MKRFKSNNRTSALFIICLVFVVSTYGQLQETNIPNNGKELPVPDDFESIKQNNKLLKHKRSESHWFDYVDDARDFGETYTYFTGSHMWPDSNAVKPFDAGPEHAGTHGGGMMFDPASLLWSVNQTEDWSRHTRYTVDSVFIPYKYFNFSSKQDSVIITFSTASNISRLSFNSGADPTSSVEYDPTTNRVVNANKEVVIYLDSSNNTDGFFTTTYQSYFQGGFELPVGLDITPTNGNPFFGNLFAVTLQFFPHRDAELGEIMTYRDSTNLDSNNLSLFSLLNMRGETVTMSDPAHNFGLYLYTNQRYSTRETEWFYPYNFPSRQRFFNYTVFKISSSTVGINQVNDDLYFALSPNPVNQSEIFTADFKIVKPGNVQISIVDIQGRTVKEVCNSYFVPGQHNIDVSIAELNPGVYQYRIETAYGSATKKFVIH